VALVLHQELKQLEGLERERYHLAVAQKAPLARVEQERAEGVAWCHWLRLRSASAPRWSDPDPRSTATRMSGRTSASLKTIGAPEACSSLRKEDRRCDRRSGSAAADARLKIPFY
jgi:hypothetical protein